MLVSPRAVPPSFSSQAMSSDPATDFHRERARELMMRVARNPRICCGCLCLSDEDKARARRVFRVARVVSRAWAKEERAGRGAPSA
jgi:hypothetical protein